MKIQKAWLVRRIGFILCGALTLGALPGCDGGQAQPQTTPPAPMVTTAPTQPQQTEAVRQTEEVNADIPVETPYVTLYYPEAYGQYLQLEMAPEGREVRFLAVLEHGTYSLFDLSFGAGQGELIGAVEDSGGQIILVWARVHELQLQECEDWEVELLYGMQEAVGDLAAQLSMPQEEPRLLLETPFCDLQVTALWGDALQIRVEEGNGYALCFTAKLQDREPQPLFDVIFDGTGDEYAGTLRLEGDLEILVSLNIYEFVPGEDWSREETDMVYSMMELLNQVLEQLENQDGFTAA